MTLVFLVMAASSNFGSNHIWITYEEGTVVNPYKLLPSLFDDLDQEVVDEFQTEDQIADGGAAIQDTGQDIGP